MSDKSAERMRRLRERRRAHGTCSECKEPLGGDGAGICDGCKSKLRDNIVRSMTIVPRRIGPARPAIDDLDDDLGHLSATERAQIKRLRLPIMPAIRVESIANETHGYVNAGHWNHMREPHAP